MPTTDLLNEVLRREPRLNAVLNAARRERRLDLEYSRTNAYLRFKADAYNLVGWGAETDDPLLRSADAYDTFLDAMYAALPH